MPAQPVTNPIESEKKLYNMELLQDNYIPEIPPKRFPAGSIIQVDGDTAFRWIEYGVAKPAPASARTYRDEQADQKRKLLAELEAMGAAEPVYNAAITRDSFRDEGRIGPQPMPKRGRRGKAERPALDGANVVIEDLVGDDDDDEIKSDYP